MRAWRHGRRAWMVVALFALASALRSTEAGMIAGAPSGTLTGTVPTQATVGPYTSLSWTDCVFGTVTPAHAATCDTSLAVTANTAVSLRIEAAPLTNGGSGRLASQYTITPPSGSPQTIDPAASASAQFAQAGSSLSAPSVYAIHGTAANDPASTIAGSYTGQLLITVVATGSTGSTQSTSSSGGADQVWLAVKDTTTSLLCTSSAATSWAYWDYTRCSYDKTWGASVLAQSTPAPALPLPSVSRYLAPGPRTYYVWVLNSWLDSTSATRANITVTIGGKSVTGLGDGSNDGVATWTLLGTLTIDPAVDTTTQLTFARASSGWSRYAFGGIYLTTSSAAPRQLDPPPGMTATTTTATFGATTTSSIPPCAADGPCRIWLAVKDTPNPFLCTSSAATSWAYWDYTRCSYDKTWGGSVLAKSTPAPALPLASIESLIAPALRTYYVWALNSWLPSSTTNCRANFTVTIGTQTVSGLGDGSLYQVYTGKALLFDKDTWDANQAAWSYLGPVTISPSAWIPTQVQFGRVSGCSGWSWYAMGGIYLTTEASDSPTTFSPPPGKTATTTTAVF